MCLVPFCGKAFHIDDTLFLWAAQHIVRHPLDPYGFSVVWYWEPMPMANVTKNPPAAAYYMAAVGKVAGFSEPVMHLAFLLPALVVVLGTYRLARGFTGRPLLAAAATLLAPGFLVSSTDVMCDTMMLAAWILAVMLWREGLEGRDAGLLALAGVLVVVCWNMAEKEEFLRLLHEWRGAIVLAATFGLTLLEDLTVGIVAGCVLAALIAGCERIFRRDVRPIDADRQR